MKVMKMINGPFYTYRLIHFISGNVYSFSDNMQPLINPESRMSQRPPSRFQ